MCRLFYISTYNFAVNNSVLLNESWLVALKLEQYIMKALFYVCNRVLYKIKISEI